MGTFAVETLECRWMASANIRQPLKHFEEEFQIFLSARDLSSGAIVLHAMEQLWRALGELSLYNKLRPEDKRMLALIPHLRECPDVVNEMLIPGTPRHEGYTRWMEKLERLEDELRAFVKNSEWMLSEFFQDLPTR